MINIYSSKIKWQKGYWVISQSLIFLWLGLLLMTNYSSFAGGWFLLYASYFLFFGYIFLIILYLLLLLISKIFSKLNYKIVPISEKAKKLNK